MDAKMQEALDTLKAAGVTVPFNRAVGVGDEANMMLNKMRNDVSHMEESMKISNLKPPVTSIADLQKVKQGEIVEFSPFMEGVPFVARVHRPSMVVLMKRGKIPNELLASAMSLFMDGSQALNQATPEQMKQIFDMFDVMAESILIEPSYAQLKEAGVSLTDEQYADLFAYAQAGVKPLNSFRQK